MEIMRIDLSGGRSKQIVRNFMRLANYIAELPLPSSGKDKLNELVGDLIFSAERDAFLGGLKVAKKGIDVVVDEGGVRHVIQ